MMGMWLLRFNNNFLDLRRHLSRYSALKDDWSLRATFEILSWAALRCDVYHSESSLCLCANLTAQRDDQWILLVIPNLYHSLLTRDLRRLNSLTPFSARLIVDYIGNQRDWGLDLHVALSFFTFVGGRRGG